MKTAISLSRIGSELGGPFGAVIVKDGKIICGTYNKVVPANDPTAHAEILAIRKACEILRTHDLSGCEIHCSCEPCPMCHFAIQWAGIDTVYCAATRYDAKRAGFSDQHMHNQFIVGALWKPVYHDMDHADEAAEILRQWEGARY